MDFDTGLFTAMCAVHEAGHVVLAREAGLEVTGVWVDPSGTGPTGGTELPPWELPWHTAGAMLAAGEQAARRWMIDSGYYTPTRGWAAEVLAREDRAQAANSNTGPIDIVTDDSANPHDWRHLGVCARRRLDARWGDVLDIATALVQRGRLTPDTYPLNERR